MKNIKPKTFFKIWSNQLSLTLGLHKLSLVAAILVVWGSFLIFPKITLGAPVDLIPPEIKIGSPTKNSIIDTGSPLIEARVGDTGSGIDEKSIYLVLDQINVTDQALIENIDVTGQALEKIYKIRYRPKAPLIPGEHEVYLGVRDQAGNLTELRWRFTVSLPKQNEIVISGSNTLQWAQYPLMKADDTLDLTTQARLAGTDLRLRLSGHGADYPEKTPLFRYDQYNLYLDKYSLSLQRSKSNLIMGFGVSPLESELFQGGVEIKGGIFTQNDDFTKGQLNWALFSGETASSYGMGISVYKINGAVCRWESASGWRMGAFYVQPGGSSGFDLSGFQGNTQFGAGYLARFELLSGYSRINNVSGNGFALHLDKSFDVFNMGLDYALIQPTCPISGGSNSFSVGQGGAQRIGVRTAATFNTYHNIGFDILLSESDLDHNNLYNIKQGNVLFNYRFAPDTHFDISVNYSGGFQFNKGELSNFATESNNTLSLNLNKEFNLSALHTSLSIEESELTAPSSQIVFFSDWTKHIDNYNLTPSLRLVKKNGAGDSYNYTAETRLTLDYQVHPDVARSKVALFWNSSDSNLGLESSTYLLLWHNSSISAIFNLSHCIGDDRSFPDGWDKTLSLTWRASL